MPTANDGLTDSAHTGTLVQVNSSPRSVAFTLLDLLASLALRRATRETAPLTPNVTLTTQLVQRLQCLGLIQIADSTRAPELPVERALYDPIGFSWYESSESDDFSENGLRLQVRAYLSEPTANGDITAVWMALAAAEVEGYLEALLRKHKLPPQWSLSARSLCAIWLGRLSLAKLRYVVWACIQAANSTFSSSNSNLDKAHKHFENSIRARPLNLISGSSAKTDNLPFPGQRDSLLTSTFLSEVMHFGKDYWTALPLAETVKQLRDREQ